jgi:hypothetical protein
VLFRFGARETFTLRWKAPDASRLCLCYGAASQWHLGEIASCQAAIAVAILIAKRRGFVMPSHQNRKGAKVGFARETRRSNLRRISQAKSERVRRGWIPTISLINHQIPVLSMQAEQLSYDVETNQPKVYRPPFQEI